MGYNTYNKTVRQTRIKPFAAPDITLNKHPTMTKSSGPSTPVFHPLVGDVEQYLAEFPETVRRQFKGKLYAEAAIAQKFDDTYQAAFANAVAQHYRDPETHAISVGIISALKARQNCRTSARNKRSEASLSRMVDGKARTLEKAKSAEKRRASLAPKNPRRTVVRKPQIDKQYIDIVGKYQRAGYETLSPLVFAELEKKKDLKAFKIHPHDKSSYVMKIAGSLYAANKLGAVTFNLRLSPTKIEAALKSPKGPSAYLADRITKHLKPVIAGSPQFTFVIETDGAMSRRSAFHIHGAVVVPDDANTLAQVEQALKAAVGEWENPKGQYLQIKCDPLAEAVGWARYIEKHMNLTRHRLDEYAEADLSLTKVFSISHGLRRATREHWHEFQASMPQPGRKKKGASRGSPVAP